MPGFAFRAQGFNHAFLYGIRFSGIYFAVLRPAGVVHEVDGAAFLRVRRAFLGRVLIRVRDPGREEVREVFGRSRAVRLITEARHLAAAERLDVFLPLAAEAGKKDFQCVCPLSERGEDGVVEGDDLFIASVVAGKVLEHRGAGRSQKLRIPGHPAEEFGIAAAESVNGLLHVSHPGERAAFGERLDDERPQGLPLGVVGVLELVDEKVPETDPKPADGLGDAPVFKDVPHAAGYAVVENRAVLLGFLIKIVHAPGEIEKAAVDGRAARETIHEVEVGGVFRELPLQAIAELDVSGAGGCALVDFCFFVSQAFAAEPFVSGPDADFREVLR